MGFTTHIWLAGWLTGWLAGWLITFPSGGQPASAGSGAAEGGAAEGGAARGWRAKPVIHTAQGGPHLFKIIQPRHRRPWAEHLGVRGRPLSRLGPGRGLPGPPAAPWPGTAARCAGR